MKKITRLCFAFLLGSGLIVSVRAAVETYQIDPVHSGASFTVRHIVSRFTGSFTKVTGTLLIDRDNLEHSSVTAAVDVGSLNTANEKRDADVKSPNFLDYAKFGAMTFKSTSWKKTGDDTYDVAGDLTIKDVTKPVVLKVRALGFAAGMKPGTQVSGWTATTAIKKSEFGVAGPAMLSKIVGDDVTINLDVEADTKP